MRKNKNHGTRPSHHILISNIIRTSYQMLIIKPIVLEGNYVLLPLTTDGFGLSQGAKDGEIWNNLYALFPHENDISAYLQVLLKESNLFLPFLIVDNDTIVGSTRYLNIDYDNHRMEIGHTCIRKVL